MDEDAAQGVRRKKDSTLVRAAEAVRDGTASAMISAGNTGATMASALLRMGRIKGVSRPAIATPIPVPGHAAEHPPRRRRQRRGAARVAGAVRADGVGVLAPPVRRRRARRSACCRSARSPARATRCARRRTSCSSAAPGINFIGNVEGRDMMLKTADVIVTDGFTGNVVLKTLEGGLKMLIGEILNAFASEPQYKPHADALLPALHAAVHADEPRHLRRRGAAGRRRRLRHQPRVVQPDRDAQRDPGRHARWSRVASSISSAPRSPQTPDASPVPLTHVGLRSALRSVRAPPENDRHWQNEGERRARQR